MSTKKSKTRRPAKLSDQYGIVTGIAIVILSKGAPPAKEKSNDKENT
jgi:hypothetical protein